MFYYPGSDKTFADHSAIRTYFSNTIFSDVITQDQLEYVGIVNLVYEPPVPEENLVAIPVAVVREDDEWVQQWDIREMTEDEIEAAKPKMPEQVTRRQARQALLIRGMLDKVNEAFNAIADPQKRALAQIEWEDSQTFERHRPLVIEIAAAIGLDDAGLDALFIEAARL